MSVVDDSSQDFPFLPRRVFPSLPLATITSPEHLSQAQVIHNQLPCEEYDLMIEGELGNCGVEREA